MTVCLSNQPQIPVIAPGYSHANKHVWEGQWLRMDMQTLETGPLGSDISVCLEAASDNG